MQGLRPKTNSKGSCEDPAGGGNDLHKAARSHRAACGGVKRGLLADERGDERHIKAMSATFGLQLRSELEWVEYLQHLLRELVARLADIFRVGALHGVDGRSQ